MSEKLPEVQLQLKGPEGFNKTFTLGVKSTPVRIFNPYVSESIPALVLTWNDPGHMTLEIRDVHAEMEKVEKKKTDETLHKILKSKI